MSIEEFKHLYEEECKQKYKSGNMYQQMVEDIHRLLGEYTELSLEDRLKIKVFVKMITHTDTRIIEYAEDNIVLRLQGNIKGLPISNISWKLK